MYLCIYLTNFIYFFYNNQSHMQNCDKLLLTSPCLSVCPSVRLHETVRLQVDEFSWSLIFECFSKIILENSSFINPLNAELNPICYLLALLGTHHFVHVSRIRVKSLTPRLLMSYIYIWSACGRSPAEIVGSNPTGGMDICLL